METFNFNNERLAYSCKGNSDHPVMIFVHGWGSFRGIWREVVDTLSKDYYCVTIDLLGHGESEKHRQGDYSIQAQAQRVLALVDYLHIDKFILIGHSMGGKIALYITAELAPERVIKLIDVAGTVKPPLSPVVMWMISPACQMFYHASWTLTLLRPWFRFRTVTRLLVGWSWFHNFDKVTPFYWEESARNAYQRGMNITLMASLFEALQALDLTPLLSKIKCPTLVIFGKQDRIVPVSDGEIVGRNVATSRLVLFDDCGHFPFADQPSAFLAVVKEFLE